MGLDGIEIFTNSSASYHELRKAEQRVNLVRSATTKVSYTHIPISCHLTEKDFCPETKIDTVLPLSIIYYLSLPQEEIDSQEMLAIKL